MNPLQKWKTNHIKRWVKDNELNFRVSTEGVKQPNGKRIRIWCVRNVEGIFAAYYKRRDRYLFLK